MTIQPITEKTPLCYGVLCELHARCSRYLGVERMPAGAIVIGTCATPPAVERPLFVQVKVAAA